MNDYSLRMSRRNTNKNVSVSTLLHSDKEQIGSLVIKAEPRPTPRRTQELLAQLNDNARLERNTDEQMLRILVLTRL